MVSCSITKPLPAVEIPANLKAPCDALPPFEGNSMGDLLEHAIDVAQLYKICSLRHEKLIELL